MFIKIYLILFIMLIGCKPSVSENSSTKNISIKSGSGGFYSFGWSQENKKFLVCENKIKNSICDGVLFVLSEKEFKQYFDDVLCVTKLKNITSDVLKQVNIPLFLGENFLDNRPVIIYTSPEDEGRKFSSLKDAFDGIVSIVIDEIMKSEELARELSFLTYDLSLADLIKTIKSKEMTYYSENSQEFKVLKKIIDIKKNIITSSEACPIL